MAGTRSIEVKVGVLILTALGLLAGFILVMGGLSFQPSYSLFVDFDNPAGLQSGAAVKIAGVRVGKIQEIQFRGAELGAGTGKREPLVRVKVAVERRYQRSIRENSIFYVTTLGVLGEQFLAIEPGNQDRPVLPEGSVVRGLDPPRLDMLFAEAYELLHTTMTALRENREQISETFDALRATLKGTGQFFHGNGEKLDRIVTNLEQTTAEANELVRTARPQALRVLDHAEKLSLALSRDADPMLADARETLQNARRLSAVVGSPDGQAKVKKILDDAADASGRMRTAAADASSILAHVKRGKGSVGAVVMDEQLYDDIQELVRDLKHNPWKFLWRE